MTPIVLELCMYPRVPLPARAEASVNLSIGFEAIQGHDLGSWRITPTDDW